MERGGSALESIYEEQNPGETLDLHYDGEDDVEMADADQTLHVDATAAGGEGGGGERSKKRRSGKKKKRSGKKKRVDGPPATIADINRFVLDTCRRLKEKKSYLVWNAVGCLGVSAVSDLVKEVDAIQKFGGQKTADGSRFRSGGGILWNILRSREPKAYKEIMAKGRELEKQFRQTKVRQRTSRNEDTSSQGSVLLEEEIEALDENEVLDDPEQLVDIREEELPSDDKTGRKPVVDRIRVPVAYDDLFEEGEIHEEPQN